jgi:hypothetical protein
MANDVRKPRVGDHVAAIGHSGTFEVTSVNDHVRTADLKLIPTGTLLNKAPWTALSYGTDERELSEAANRAGDRSRKGKRSSYEQGT